ncbi:hypothetical protein C8R43DRAFT_905709 [Mycena crocata]|nr:hypothetical protein C8R43DRAFT_905709 [Mycena crocata]
MLRPQLRTRSYATVSSIPKRLSEHVQVVPSELDKLLLAQLSSGRRGSSPNLPHLIHQYTQESGRVLASSLPYESRPAAPRRCTFENNSRVYIIAHCASSRSTRTHKITVSSGFALAAEEGDLILTCAHTLEEARTCQSQIRRSPLLQEADVSSGSFLVSEVEGSICVEPVSNIVSAIPRSDILVMRSASSNHRTFPVSPYPATRDTAIRAHFVAHNCPQEHGWTPWMGGTWSKWVRGTILGYRDFAGRETEPGTYDSLSHLLFSQIPTPGSSGGPIVDEESGAVVGVVLGSRMDNRVEGIRGWGVPAEAVFEMFALPGLRKK